MSLSCIVPINTTDPTKQLKFNLSGQTTGTTTILVTTSTSNRSVTIPDATDTLVNLNSAQTLNNKVYGGSSSSTQNIVTTLYTGAQGTTGGATITTFADPTAAILSGNRLGSHSFGGSVNASHTLYSGGVIAAHATENWSGTAGGSQMRFYTTPNTTQTATLGMTLGQDQSLAVVGPISAPSITASSTPINLASGGTNNSLVASNGGIAYSDASKLNLLSGTATANQVLLSGASSAPSWSTATYPSTAGTSGNFLQSDGTNWVSTPKAIFSAVNTTSPANVTGDGTTYTVICDTANTNITSSYNTSTGVFTAPVTGNYLFAAYVSVTGLTALDTAGDILLVTTGNTYNGTQNNPGAVRFVNTTGFAVSVVCPMTATDTAYLTIAVAGSTKTIGIQGYNGSSQPTYFTGHQL